MELGSNPLYVTYRRLAERHRLWPSVVATLVLCSVALFALVHFEPAQSGVARSLYFERAYFAGLVVEALLLLVAGHLRIARQLREERSSGLFEANWLTAMKPRDLLLGYYCLAPALREWYVAGIVAGAGFYLTLYASLPRTLWWVSQLLLVSTVLLTSLVSVCTGLLRRSGDNRGKLSLFAVGTLALVRYVPGSQSLLGCLLPAVSLGRLFPTLFYSDSQAPVTYFFGAAPPSWTFSLLIQLSAGLFLWRSASRWLRQRPGRLLSRTGCVVLFGAVLLLQVGLSGGGEPAWFDHAGAVERSLDSAFGLLLWVVFGAAIVCMEPEDEMANLVRMEGRTPGFVLRRTSGLPAVVTMALLALAACPLVVHPAEVDSIARQVPVALSLTLLATSLGLLIEVIRLRLPAPHRAGVFTFVVWTIYFLPLIIGAVFHSEPLALLSPLATVFFATARGQWQSDPAILSFVTAGLLFQGVVAAGLAWLWYRSAFGWVQKSRELIAGLTESPRR